MTRAEMNEVRDREWGSEKQEKKSEKRRKFDQFNRHVIKLKPFFRSESMVNAGRSI